MALVLKKYGVFQRKSISLGSLFVFLNKQGNVDGVIINVIDFTVDLFNTLLVGLFKIV